MNFYTLIVPLWWSNWGYQIISRNGGADKL